MTEEAALLRAIRAAPDDDAPRLVYADWLDDHTETERAEFIRVQIELAKPIPVSIEAITTGIGFPSQPVTNTDYRKDERDRAAKLLADHGSSWLPQIERAEWIGYDHRRATLHAQIEPGMAVYLGPGGRPIGTPLGSVAFSRGFIISLDLRPADWLAHADAILAAHPLTDVRLTTRPTNDQYLDMVDELAELGRLPRRDRSHSHSENLAALLSARWPVVKAWHLPESR